MDKKIRAYLSKDEILKKVLKDIKQLPVQSSTGDLYYDLIRAITFQQLSGKAATTIFNRFLELFDNAYPHAVYILDFEIADLRAVGLSKQKANYIKNIAAFALAEDWPSKDWNSYSDEELITYLTQIKGVGKWTAQMILMFTLERPDVLPLDDLVVRNMLVELYQVQGTKRAITQQLTQLAEAWRPYRSYVSRSMWVLKDTIVCIGVGVFMCL